MSGCPQDWLCRAGTGIYRLRQTGTHMPEYRTFFEKLARDRNITVEEMRSIISARIETGMNDPDLARWAQW